MPQEILNAMQWLQSHPKLYSLLCVTALGLLAWGANYLVKRILVRGLYRRLNATVALMNDSDQNVIARLSNIVPALILYRGVDVIPGLPTSLVTIVQNIAQAFIVIALALALAGALTLVERIYQNRANAHYRPIKGYVQLCKIAIYVIATVLMIATLIDRSPLILLSGIGAMAAVLMLIFQDTLLSMVASVQISSSGIIRVGDWIEMPQLNADGAVIDIALHTVKIQNWDLTITTIPTKRLITDAFKNWRGMQESGARRIKRTLFLDQNSMHFLDQADCHRLQQFKLLEDYLGDKMRELEVWNGQLAEHGAAELNARRVTNIGTFRIYVERYLRQHPEIRQDMTLIVRHLNPTAEGLPLEIYCFSNVTAWAQYERIQADIFDHLLAIVPVFHLRVFQRPGGADLHSLRDGYADI